MALGLGSNLIIRDGGVPGVVVRLGKAFASVEVRRDGVLECGGGAPGILVASKARDAGMAGLEFLRGIPGTVGGFVRMNGGAYGREVADILVDCDVVLPGGNCVTIPVGDLDYSYRHSRLPDGAIVVAARFRACRAIRRRSRRRWTASPSARGNPAAAQQDRRQHLQEPARRQAPGGWSMPLAVAA